MANSVSLVSKFLALIDAAYKAMSKTAVLDAITQSPDYLGANEVKVMKLSMVGLGNYSRSTGYPAGDLTAAWETMTLATERGRAFTLDRMDNEEMLGLVLGNLVAEWMRMHVSPELDAYRFSKYASFSGISEVGTPATLSNSTVLAAIDVATGQMNADEVPEDGRILFVSDTVQTFLDQAVTRSMNNNETTVVRQTRNYNNMQVIMVPQTRFYKGITLNAGATSSAGGFVKTASTGRDINFLMVHPSAVLQPVKLNQVKYFPPEVNQISDGHLWQYRLYHDTFVYENHVDGVYSHIKAS
jgi:hypothetical protein